jgi:hypothetical protein
MWERTRASDTLSTGLTRTGLRDESLGPVACRFGQEFEWCFSEWELEILPQCTFVRSYLFILLTIWFWLRSLSLSDMKSFRLKIHIHCSCSLKRQEINIKSWCFEWRPRSHCQTSAGSVCTLRDASQWEETVGRSEVWNNKGELMTSRWTCATELTIH